ncbi:MAG: hypothetical protein OEW06_14920 [Gemmatimonadota bacterium]|jgi:hypothetical protein|nr:hypothetical protein [Gemmatimonadota bacterium]
MYSVARIFEGGGHATPDDPEAGRALVEALGGASGLVTLLAIEGDDGALITVEIFETLDDMKAAQGAAGHDPHPSTSEGGPHHVRTIAGEIVFQRGL